MTEHGGDRDRMEGTIDEAKGKAKQAWGDLSDDDRMKAEGMIDEVRGHAEQAWGDLKDKVADLKEDAEQATR